MLEHFKLSEDIAVRVPVDRLRAATEAVFQKCGVPPSEAALGADVLMFADVRGIDTHGVSNMLRNYVTMYNAGNLNPDPQIRVVKETAGTALVDGDRGLGLMVAPKAMEIAIAKARDVGVGVVTVRNSGHLGAAGYHAGDGCRAGHGRMVHDGGRKVDGADFRGGPTTRHEPDRVCRAWG